MHLAQVNVARLLAPLDSPQLAGFVEALDPINAVADGAPGFVWRLQTEDGDATAIRPFGDEAGGLGPSAPLARPEWRAERRAVADADEMMINLSVWTSVEALAAYVYRADHADVMRSRRQWFAHLRDHVTALWWVPDDHRPTPREAIDRLTHLRRHGPTPYAFTFARAFGPPDEGSPATPRGDDWLCPA